MNFHEIKDCDPVENKIDLDVKINYKGDESESVEVSFNLPEDYGEDLEAYTSFCIYRNYFLLYNFRSIYQSISSKMTNGRLEFSNRKSPY